MSKLPDDWQISELGRIVDFLDNQRVPIKETDRAKMRGDYPYYGASGVIDYVNDYIFDDDLILLGEDGENIMSRNLPLAFRVSGKIWVNNHAHVIKPKAEYTDIGYLTEYLESLSYDKYNTGTAQPKLPKSVCEEITIVLPPLPEQRKIAAILSTWDEAIALTEQLIGALQRRKQALMQVLLTGAVRFREFEGSEWEEVQVGDVGTLTAGGTPSTYVEEYWGGDIRWMSSGEVHQKRVYEVEGRITEEGLSNSSAKLIPINSILVALAGQGKTRGTVAINKVEVSTNQSIAAIIPDPQQIDPEYLFHNLDARYEELRRLSTGDGGRGGLNLQILKSVFLQKPSVVEQKRISDVLETCDEEMMILGYVCEGLQAQKRGLMQQLLTGAVRVGV